MNTNDCIKLIRDIKVGYLATCDNNFQPYVRPIDLGTVYNGNIFFSTYINTEKVNQITTVNKVELLFVQNNLQIRIIGTVDKVDNQKTFDRYMRDNKHISEMNKDVELILFCVKPKYAKYMLSDDTQYSIIQWQ